MKTEDKKLGDVITAVMATCSCLAFLCWCWLSRRRRTYGVFKLIINPDTGKPYPKDFFRDYAKGKPCLIRLATECGHSCASFETTVLCHLTMPGLKAMSGKLIDLLGAWGCHTCHGICDGQITPRFPVESARIKQWHHDGVARTIDRLHADGILRYEF